MEERSLGLYSHLSKYIPSGDIILLIHLLQEVEVLRQMEVLNVSSAFFYAIKFIDTLYFSIELMGDNDIWIAYFFFKEMRMKRWNVALL